MNTQLFFLVGAYGRTYHNTSDAIADWKAGKDFKIANGGPYCSIRDSKLMMKDGYEVVTINTLAGFLEIPLITQLITQ